MNRLLDIVTRIVGYTLTLLLLSACIAERMDGPCPDDPSSSDSPHLTLLLAVQDMATLRAQTEDGVEALNENKIDNLWVLFYKKASGDLYWAVSPAVASDGRYIIPIPADKLDGFRGSETYQVYVVTNVAHFTAPQALAELDQQLITESVVEATPSHFVMQGKTSKQINLSTDQGKQLGEVSLRRVACKVRVTPHVEVPNYTLAGAVQVQLVNAYNQGYLITQANAPAATAIPYSARETSSDQSICFYSYYNNWSSQASRAPYCLLAIPLQATGSTVTTTYYYKVWLTPQDKWLASNKLYDLKVNVSRIGSTIPERPVEITSQELIVADWTLKKSDYDLPDANFLELSEYDMEMYNVSSRTISYRSSKHPVEIKDITASYSYVNSRGEEQTEKIAATGPDYPKITIEGDKIRITSKIPINNVPKKITFTVSNGISSLDKRVTVVQYPDRYITFTWGIESSKYKTPEDMKGSAWWLVNNAIYRITVMTPPEGVILGFPPKERVTFYQWGGNRQYSYEITKRDAETANMVSPNFEVASQMGATKPNYYAERGSLNGREIFYNNPATAICACSQYWEVREVNGERVTLRDWRLPTEAELKLIDALQQDGVSKVKRIMTARWTWDAYDDDGATKLKDNDWPGGLAFPLGNKNDFAYIRCVRDVKEDNVQSYKPYTPTK